MKRFLGLFLALVLAAPAIPQAAPKATPTPAPATQRTNPPATTTGHCAPDYYRNVNGVCVHRPVRTQNASVPVGATAQCRDGSYSFSQHRRGTCSHHGGVARWLPDYNCHGTLTEQEKQQILSHLPRFYQGEKWLENQERSEWKQ
jgi:hypothetical protein